MAQISLNWDNTGVLSNTNVTGQKASYASRSAGAWVTIGFTPSNIMAKTVNSALSPNTLVDNVVYQFKVEAICTVGGPTINDNGIREIISFSCLSPTLTHDVYTGTISLDVTSTDITKARFTLKKASDNTIVFGPTIVSKTLFTITQTIAGLAPSTNYYWTVELYAIVNSVEVISSSTDYLGTVCSPYPFRTSDEPTCNPVTSGTISSIQTG